MSNPSVRVLVVDDDAGARSALRDLLKTQGYAADVAVDGEAALERIAEQPPDVVITDLDMPRMNGMQLLAELRQRARELPVIVVTSAGGRRAAGGGRRGGAG